MVRRAARWMFPVAILLVAGLASAPSAIAASAAGYRSISYSGVANPPTSDKPQSKLWFTGGSWWADMWVSGSGWHIFGLNRATQTWVDTGVVNDTRSNTLADTMWDGTHLYIASHVVTVSTNEAPVASVSGQPAQLYRYSYSGGAYTLDAGFPTQIANNSSESMTIDEDTTGVIWATWTQVAGNASAGWTNTVYVNDSAPGGTSWQTPFVIPATAPNPAPDDISALVAFKNKIGVIWSDQLTGTVYWATRTDGTSPTAPSSWHDQVANKGPGIADDHVNIKTLQSDSSGRVYAVVKTSLNDTSTDTTLPQLLLLTFKPGTGAFTESTISTVADCVTRPQVVLDSSNNLVHVFQTAPSTTVTGCAYSGVAGSIYEKTASMDNPVFAAGRGTPVMEDPSSPNLNNVTTTKQGVDASTGLVVMASDDVAKRYWFADESLGGIAPVAAFTATPTNGTEPLPVQFTDTSTGTPTSWAWDFGDGGTATTQNPRHTYTTPGSYTVKLTATNAAGSTVDTRTGLITATAPTSSITVDGSTTTYSGALAASVAITQPVGTVTGDVLVASITADLNPTMTTVPAGWTPIVTALSINSTATAGARLFSYYHLVGPTDPATYAWTLSTAEKWGAGVTAYRGVNASTPLDSAVATAVNTDWAATQLTIPAITTISNGALLISGIGMDSATPKLSSPPAGWTQRWEAGGGQIATQADQHQLTAGGTGPATWTLSSGRAGGGWQTALKPAS